MKIDPSSDWFVVPGKAVNTTTLHIPASALVPLPPGWKPPAPGKPSAPPGKPPTVAVRAPAGKAPPAAATKGPPIRPVQRQAIPAKPVAMSPMALMPKPMLNPLRGFGALPAAAAGPGGMMAGRAGATGIKQTSPSSDSVSPSGTVTPAADSGATGYGGYTWKQYLAAYAAAAGAWWLWKKRRR